MVGGNVLRKRSRPGADKDAYQPHGPADPKLRTRTLQLPPTPTIHSNIYLHVLPSHHSQVLKQQYLIVSQLAPITCIQLLHQTTPSCSSPSSSFFLPRAFVTSPITATTKDPVLRPKPATSNRVFSPPTPRLHIFNCADLETFFPLFRPSAASVRRIFC